MKEHLEPLDAGVIVPRGLLSGKTVDEYIPADGTIDLKRRRPIPRSTSSWLIRARIMSTVY